VNEYKECDCGSDCVYFEMNDNEPCWGEVEAVDEQYTEDYSDYWWIHVCEGHYDKYAGWGDYVPKPENGE